MRRIARERGLDDEIVTRARIGLLSGEVVLGLAAVAFLALLLLALALGGVERKRDA